VVAREPQTVRWDFPSVIARYRESVERKQATGAAEKRPPGKFGIGF